MLRFVTGDILVGKIRPYFHKVGIAYTDGVVSSGVLAFLIDTLTVNSDVPRDGSGWFIPESRQHL